MIRSAFLCKTRFGLVLDAAMKTSLLGEVIKVFVDSPNKNIHNQGDRKTLIMRRQILISNSYPASSLHFPNIMDTEIQDCLSLHPAETRSS